MDWTGTVQTGNQVSIFTRKDDYKFRLDLEPKDDIIYAKLRFLVMNGPFQPRNWEHYAPYKDSQEGSFSFYTHEVWIDILEQMEHFINDDKRLAEARSNYIEKEYARLRELKVLSNAHRIDINNNLLEDINYARKVWANHRRELRKAAYGIA